MNTKTGHKCKGIEVRTLESFDVANLIGAPFKVVLSFAVLEKYCPECGSIKGHMIPKPQELIAVVGTLRACDPRKLNGKEIRFLRKSMGLNGKDFADRIGLSPAHLSKLENDREPINPRFERQLRMHVCLEHLDEVDSSLLRKIKEVPRLPIVSVRSALEDIEFHLSFEEQVKANDPAPQDDDDHKRYTNVA